MKALFIISILFAPLFTYAVDLSGQIESSYNDIDSLKTNFNKRQPSNVVPLRKKGDPRGKFIRIDG